MAKLTVLGSTLKNANSIKSSMIGIEDIKRKMQVGKQYVIFVAKDLETSSLKASSMLCRNCEYDVFKSSLIALSNVGQNLTGSPVDNGNLSNYSQIINTLHQASFKKELYTAIQLREQDYLKRGKVMSDADKVSIELALRIKYFGKEKDKDLGADAIRPTVFPIIGEPYLYTLMQAVVLPLDNNGKPVIQEMYVGTFVVNKKNRDELDGIVSNPESYNRYDNIVELFVKCDVSNNDKGKTLTFTSADNRTTIKADLTEQVIQDIGVKAVDNIDNLLFNSSIVKKSIDDVSAENVLLTYLANCVDTFSYLEAEELSEYACRSLVENKIFTLDKELFKDIYAKANLNKDNETVTVEVPVQQPTVTVQAPTVEVPVSQPTVTVQAPTVEVPVSQPTYDYNDVPF